MFVRKAWAATLLGALLLSACGGATPSSAPAPKPSKPSTPAQAAAPKAAKGKLTPFALAYPTPSGSFTPLFVAKDQGIFAKNGLDVHLDVMSGGATESSGLLSGSLQAGVVDAPAALAAMAKGVNTVFVGKIFSPIPFELWSKPSITSLKQIEGKTLGLQHVGSLSAAAADVILPREGVNLSKVHVEYLGTPAQAIAALIAGKVAAAVSTAPPVFEAKSRGFRLLFDFRKGTHMAQGFVVTRQFAQQHAPLIEALLKSWVEAVAYVDNPANEATVTHDLGAAVRVTNQKILNETYTYYKPIWSCNPTITAADMSDGVDYVTQVEHEKVDAAKQIDSAPVQALAKSGFIAQHCKG